MAALATGFTQYSNMFKYYTLPFQKNEKNKTKQKTLSANQIKRERSQNYQWLIQKKLKGGDL